MKFKRLTSGVIACSLVVSSMTAAGFYLPDSEKTITAVNYVGSMAYAGEATVVTPDSGTFVSSAQDDNSLYLVNNIVNPVTVSQLSGKTAFEVTFEVEGVTSTTEYAFLNFSATGDDGVTVNLVSNKDPACPPIKIDGDGTYTLKYSGKALPNAPGFTSLGIILKEDKKGTGKYTTGTKVSSISLVSVTIPADETEAETNALSWTGKWTRQKGMEDAGTGTGMTAANAGGGWQMAVSDIDMSGMTEPVMEVTYESSLSTVYPQVWKGTGTSSANVVSASADSRAVFPLSEFKDETMFTLSLTNTGSITGIKIYDKAASGGEVDDATATYEIGKENASDVVAKYYENESKLVISGTGEMRNLTTIENAPWNSVIDNIKTVVIEDGVTNIGNYMFQNATALESVTIPESVTTIGNNTFSNAGASEQTTVEIIGTTAMNETTFTNFTGTINAHKQSTYENLLMYVKSDTAKLGYVGAEELKGSAYKSEFFTEDTTFKNSSDNDLQSQQNQFEYLINDTYYSKCALTDKTKAKLAELAPTLRKITMEVEVDGTVASPFTLCSCMSTSISGGGSYWQTTISSNQGGQYALKYNCTQQTAKVTEAGTYEITIIINPGISSEQLLSNDWYITALEYNTITNNPNAEVKLKSVTFSDTLVDVAPEIEIGESTTDFSALNEAIAAAKDIDTSLYTAESVELFNTALSNAITMAANTNATQSEVDAAKEQLDEAVAGLENISVVSSGAEWTGNWTKNSASTFKTDSESGMTAENYGGGWQFHIKNIDVSGMEEPVMVVTSPDDKIQVWEGAGISGNNLANRVDSGTEIAITDKSVTDFTLSVYAMGSITGVKIYDKAKVVDFSELDAAIAAAEEVDTSLYTDDSVAAFTTAFDAAKALKESESAVQADVNEAAKALNDAIDGLVDKPVVPAVDFSALETAIEDAEAIDTSDYTDDSVAELTKAINDAKAILDDENAAQDDVDAAVNAINSAIDGLTEKTEEPTSSEQPEEPTSSENPEEPTSSEEPEDPTSSEKPSDSSEPSDSDNSSKPDDTDNSSSASEPSGDKVPDTGAAAGGLGMLLAAIGLGTSVVKKRKK